VIVTHDIRVGRKCDRILHMRDGALVSQDEDIDELTEELKDEH
jgi:ABC-type lipoprotein export system ATPase subunit